VREPVGEGVGKPAGALVVASGHRAGVEVDPDGPAGRAMGPGARVSAHAGRAHVGGRRGRHRSRVQTDPRGIERRRRKACFLSDGGEPLRESLGGGSPFAARPRRPPGAPASREPECSAGRRPDKGGRGGGRGGAGRRESTAACRARWGSAYDVKQARRATS
jgi:hypothetical protein